MQVVHERCCGLDIHKKSVVACVLVPGPAGVPTREVRSFGTMTADLLALGDWLAEQAVTAVAMESTGVYWQPIYNLLEEQFTLLLVNARHVKAVPGRKTDVQDAEWLADLLRHGLLRGSFVPTREQRELRELTRYRAALVRDHTAEVNRLQKTLEGANIKLAAVATDVNGVSARAMLTRLVAGQTEPAALAELAKGRLRAKIPELEQALVGRFAAHQRFLVAEHLEQLDHLEAKLARVTVQIEERLRPFEEAIARLDTIPGIGRVIAEAIVAEIGTDLSRFPTERHLAAWAGLAPGQHESAGKRRPEPTRKGNKTLRRLLAEAAKAASRASDTYLAAQYQRLRRRLGPNKATIAVAHSILIIVYHLLTRHQDYRELGRDYFTRRDRDATQRRLVHDLEALGYKVSLERQEDAA
jgi:transposase